MNDIFQEVDEALKQEKLEKFWHDHKDQIIAAIVALIVLSALVTFYKSWDRNRNGEATAIVYEAIENKNYTAIEEASGSLKPVGYLIAGGIELEENEEQSKRYFSKALTQASKRDIKDLAALYNTKFENETQAKNIQNIANDDKSAWQFHAAIQNSALLAEEEKYEEAIQVLDVVLSSDIVAPTLKQRASSMAHIYKIAQNNKTQEGKDNDQ